MWVRFRHKIIFALVRPFFAVYLRLKYGFTAKKYKLAKGPYVLLFNHPTNFDPFMMAYSIKGPIYFVANDDIFNNPFLAPIIKYLVAPIPKMKAIRDTSVIRSCIKVVKEGGRIGISPEGNRNYRGRLNHIDKSIVKLIKLLKVPVVLYNIKGGFGVNPRFSKVVRKGRMYGEISRIISVEEVRDYPEDELYDIIIKGLDADDLTLNRKYRCKARAENLESVFYVCPVCKHHQSLYSKGHYLYCRDCGLKVEYTEDLRFKTDNEHFSFQSVNDYYCYQEDYIRNSDLKDFAFSDDDIRLREIIKHKRRKILTHARLSISPTSLVVYNNEGREEINLDDIISMAIIYHNTLVINLEHHTYQISGDESFNALKYMHYFNQQKNMKEGTNHGYLGI
ncbi:MAG: 1-acyl-sn-glycerol-3-phosphate acyltransferase [Acholeplasmataceae bacterium]|nr:1-acyl-sn-glycerol-3-phosphate acyltransferase [Acholeplasmataceae bacterium]